MAKITCQICGEQVHSIQLHLKDHPGVTIAEYQSQYPDAPVLSDEARARLEERQIRAAMATTASGVNVVHLPTSDRKMFLHDAFGLGSASAARNSRGDGIEITILGTGDHEDFVPEVDKNYVWDIETLKTALMGFELNMTLYLYGHSGTGKTTMLEQICAHRNQPMIRVQHTVNMTESDVIGQWTVRNGETIFELGPLSLAMKYGWLYLADEYDFALPNVLSVYQPVLEGKPLIIKEADHANRVIHPHPHFRFAATGNTNGTGDDTGLYQGTTIQNAANYSRFAITMNIGYMDSKLEVRMIQGQANVTQEDASQLVEWASMVRKAFDGGKIGSTVGPRELINAAKIGSRKASIRSGVELAITNRMTAVDREIAQELVQRHIVT